MMTAEFPERWLPEGPDDLVLIELFASCWQARRNYSISDVKDGRYAPPVEVLHECVAGVATQRSFMDDSDSSQEETSPGRAAPSIAFAQAMAGVAARRSQITTSLNSREFAQVEHVFRSAANLWLAGRSACHRLMANRLMANGQEATPDIKPAMDLLNENYRALLELLARAYKAIEELSVRKSLDDVRMSIVKAMAQPLHETTESAMDAKDRR